MEDKQSSRQGIKIIIDLQRIPNDYSGHIDLRCGFDNGKPRGKVRILNAEQLLGPVKLVGGKNPPLDNCSYLRNIN